MGNRKEVMREFPFNSSKVQLELVRNNNLKTLKYFQFQ